MRKRVSRSPAKKNTGPAIQSAHRLAAEALEQRVLLSSISTLASFSSSGPFNSSGSVVHDSAGTLYGIVNNVGSQATTSGIFKLDKGSSTPTLVATLPPALGFSATPYGLLIDSSDNIFGVISIGGDSTLDGTVFELPKGASAITNLALFDQATNGNGPNGNIVMDSSGNIFGVTNSGGTLGGGTVWKFTKANNTITQLAPFPKGTGVVTVPEANSIAIDSNGNLFGTTGGFPDAGVFGTVWELPSQQSTIQTLASFSGVDGSVPTGPIAVDASGNVFGATQYGGPNNPGGFIPAGAGVVYEVVAGSGTITDLAAFDGTNGQHPVGGLVADAGGNLFGIAKDGGTVTSQATFGAGNVFEVVKDSKTITPVIAFNGTNGARPIGSVLLDSSGNIFGTTTSGGATSAGTVFEITPGGGGGGGSNSGTFTAAATVKSPGSIIAGQKITATITAKLTNTGATTVSTGIAFAAYLSADGTVDNNSIALVTSKSQHFSIKPKKAITARATIRGTPAATPPGTYHYIVEFKNSDGTTTDFQSSNTVTVAAPVIDIGGTYAKFVNKTKHSKPFTETITVTNTGANVAAAGNLSFVVAYLLTGGAPSVNPPITIKKKINIRPGKSVRIPLTLKAPAAVGVYSIFINLDASAIPVATDSNLENNTLLAPGSLLVN